MAEGDSPEVSVKDEHKSGELVSLKRLKDYYGGMENWTKILYDFLAKQNG